MHAGTFTLRLLSSSNLTISLHFFTPVHFLPLPLNRHEGFHWVSAVIYFKAVFLIKCAPKRLHSCSSPIFSTETWATTLDWWWKYELSHYYDGTEIVGGMWRSCKMKIRPIESNSCKLVWLKLVCASQPQLTSCHLRANCWHATWYLQIRPQVFHLWVALYCWGLGLFCFHNVALLVNNNLYYG